MENFKKFDLNEKTETTASDSTAPVKSEGEEVVIDHMQELQKLEVMATTDPLVFGNILSEILSVRKKEAAVLIKHLAGSEKQEVVSARKIVHHCNEELKKILGIY